MFEAGNSSVSMATYVPIGNIQAASPITVLNIGGFKALNYTFNFWEG